ncbi:MAG TPA: hypothetical protein PKY59_07660 [Pyrinomonadaceae bacterium]|nr:hypothetical protein [Pyrinomonadaceae bacterium]
MATARKFAVANKPMSPDSRKRAIAAIQIMWQQMRPDLHGDRDGLREERLIWISSFLDLKKPITSVTKLSDGQIGVLLEEMKRLTGNAKPKSGGDVRFARPRPALASPSGAKIIHLATEEQEFTAQKIFDFLGWNVVKKEQFLMERFKCPNVRMLRYEKAHSLMMILLNIAAHADLKSKGRKTGRAETAKHIKVIKRQLKIGD